MHIITDLEQILLDGYHISAVDAYWEQFDEWGKQSSVSLTPLIQVIITFPEPSLTGSLTDCLPKAWCVSNYKHNTVSSQVSCTGYQGGIYKAVHPLTNLCDQAHALAVQSHGIFIWDIRTICGQELWWRWIKSNRWCKFAASKVRILELWAKSHVITVSDNPPEGEMKMMILPWRRGNHSQVSSTTTWSTTLQVGWTFGSWWQHQHIHICHGHSSGNWGDTGMTRQLWWEQIWLIPCDIS